MPAWLLPLILGGISAGTTIYGAKKSADAAKQAAQTQSASVDKGVAAVTQAHQQGQQALQPWAAGGLEAYNTMRTLSGLGMPTLASGGAAPTTAPLSLQTMQRPQLYSQPYGVPVDEDNLPIGRKWSIPRSDYLEASNEPSSRAQAQRASGYVQMQAPDGSVNAVPAWDVAKLIEKGARVVA